ncbi:MAG: hypothetical protein L3K09_08230 [Thermoplasmata archaeon]|nr:hypothetical protein [Thermoplasmata archaeon]
MYKDGQIVCDSCQTMITHLTGAPAEGYPKMHDLCSACFAELWKKS